jgi:hypothetical protein
MVWPGWNGVPGIVGAGIERGDQAEQERETQALECDAYLGRAQTTLITGRTVLESTVVTAGLRDQHRRGEL